MTRPKLNKLKNILKECILENTVPDTRPHPDLALIDYLRKRLKKCDPRDRDIHDALYNLITQLEKNLTKTNSK